MNIPPFPSSSINALYSLQAGSVGQDPGPLPLLLSPQDEVWAPPALLSPCHGTNVKIQNTIKKAVKKCIKKNT